MTTREFVREGVWVTHTIPDARNARPALVFVHGGMHASWCWDYLLPVLARAGWECLAFDWFNHGRSARTDLHVFLDRGIGAITEEIGIVTALADGPPVLIGHSMGAAACLAYAAEKEAAALALLTPVVPAGLGAEPIEIPPVQPDTPFGPVPLDMARHMFFTSLDEQEARRYHALLCAESPRAVTEATRWQLQVDLNAIDIPVLTFAGDRDVLCPPAAVELLVQALGAEYVLLPGRGHDDVLLADGCWQQVAEKTEQWLAARIWKLVTIGVRHGCKPAA